VIRVLLLALLLCAGNVRADDAPVVAQEQVQVLLMLRAPPEHYRPDSAYVNAYQAPGRTARKALARRLAQSHGLRMHENWAMPVLGVDCFVLDAADAAAAARAVAALARDPRVESVQPMQRFHVLAASQAPADAGRDPLYAAQPAATLWHLAELHRHATGVGIRIAVVDTGVAMDHPDLQGQVALQRNFVDARERVAERHGTEVAGVIAARAGNGVGIAGIAPQARLLALRACWQRSAARSECNSFTLAKALQFAIEHRAQVLNLSLGGAPDTLLGRLLDVALRRDIVVVAAIDPELPGGGFPASHPGVWGATDARRANTPATAMWVPGTGIPAPTPEGGWAMVAGSSFAAAQLSGLVALVRQRAPDLDTRQMRAWMRPSGSQRDQPAQPEGVPGLRAVDACAVMSRADGACVCNCTIASATMDVPHR
jgi:subtilisin family serine protease